MKKFSTIILAGILCASMLSDVSAYSFSQENTKYGTSGKLSVNGDGKATIPWIGTCIMQSYGNSKFEFYKKNMSYTAQLSKHLAEIKVGGFGGLSISSDGVELSLTGDSDSVIARSGGVRDWDYSFVASKGRMLTYMQTHTVSYKLKKNDSVKASVTLSGYWKWGF